MVHSVDFCGPKNLHPLKPTEGEKLPPSFFRNSEGLLVRGEVSFTVMREDLGILEREIRFLLEHVIIARTMTGDLTVAHENAWLSLLRPRASPGSILGDQQTGAGLLYIRTDSPVTTQKIPLNPMHQFDGGMMIYQPWIQGFNSRNPKGLLSSNPILDFFSNLAT